MTAQPDMTQLLLDARAGHRAVFDRLFSHVCDVLQADVPLDAVQPAVGSQS